MQNTFFAALKKVQLLWEIGFEHKKVCISVKNAIYDVVETRLETLDQGSSNAI